MSTPTIENIIVVMLENRSYDNVLGGLYLSTNPPPYNQAPAGQIGLNGLTGSEWNPNYDKSPGEKWFVTVANNAGETQVNGSGTYYPPTTIPVIDPGETFKDMAFQITGAKQSSNPYPSWSPVQPLSTPPSTSPSPPSQMSGFTVDYMLDRPGSVMPLGKSINDVMNYFTPTQVPVTAWLANHFAVCDQWFASVPTQTFANRAFSHCAAPSVANPTGPYSLIDDVQYASVSLVDLPSIFSQLDAAYPNTSPNWKVYFHDYSISMLTVPYVMAKATTSPNANVATYDNSDWGTGVPQPITELTASLNKGPTQGPLALSSSGAVPSTFMEDLANEALPMYAVIEPRYSNGIVNTLHVQLTPNCYPPNSNHPGAANFPPAGVNPVGPTNPPIDVADGEAFLRQLYNALQQSSYWNKTLLIITYDEHGGLYDHVAPPVASPPGQTTSSPSIAIPPVGNDDPVSNGFTFNVYGCRVPTILVSPYIAAGTQISPPASSPFFDHTSIIKTVWECFFTNGSPTNPPSVSSLTARDEAAPGLYGFLDFGIYNNPGQC